MSFLLKTYGTHAAIETKRQQNGMPPSALQEAVFGRLKGGISHAERASLER